MHGPSRSQEAAADVYPLCFLHMPTTPPQSQQTGPRAAHCELQEQIENLSCQGLEERFQSVTGNNISQENQITESRGRKESKNKASSFFKELGKGREWPEILCEYLSI